MWICSNCKDNNPDGANDCPRCGFARPIAGRSVERPARVNYKLIRGSFSSWETVFAEAAAFATAVGSERLISISHSEDHNEGVVTVWCWD